MTTTISINTTALSHTEMLSSQIRYYGSLIILVIGTISCACNFITFTAPQLRSNSCAFYLLTSSLFEFFTITFGLLSAYAFELFGSTLWNTNQIFCKVRSFLAHATPLISTYLVLLSAVDRYMSSSTNVHLRAFSQIKMAYRATVVAIGIGFISCTPVAVGYVVRPRCRKMPGTYEMFDSIFAVSWLGVIPHLLMLVFGSLTFLNIRRSKKQIRKQIKTISLAQNQRQRNR
jgi:signal transduction histidine kinase